MAKKGRKKSENPKDIIRSIRWTKEEWQILCRNALAFDVSVSSFIRETVLRLVK